jgi:hypothetical protein
MKKETKLNVFLAALYFAVLTYFATILTSCHIPRRTAYSCPLHPSKRGAMYQKLPKPQPIFVAGKFGRP